MERIKLYLLARHMRHASFEPQHDTPPVHVKSYAIERKRLEQIGVLRYALDEYLMDLWALVFIGGMLLAITLAFVHIATQR